jgi:hypothetical protein
MHQPVQLPIAFKRPRMYIGEGSCFELHYLIVGFLLNEAQREPEAHSALLSSYHDMMKREFGSDGGVWQLALSSRRGDEDLAWLIALATTLIERHNALCAARQT